MLKGDEIRMLIGGFPKLTRLAMNKFAIMPGMEALLGTSAPGQLEEIALGSYEEEEVNELVAGLRSKAPRSKILTSR